MFWNFAIVILGLALFEIISSVDNAIINVHILKTLTPRFRRFFLVWGLLIAVFVVRGLLPFVIVWIANPAMSINDVITASFSNNTAIKQALETSKPLLLLGGGVYLFLVFLAWLFLEEKKYAFWVEHFIHRQSVWFYAFSSLFLTIVVYYTVKIDAFLALSASIGATIFFITDGFKKNAEEKEKDLLTSSMGAWSKILYLEAIDASFSIDGVVGAFAFTTAVPLIILGNGLGAWVVRKMTIKGIDTISKFAYLKNGAMYTIGVLGLLMVFESFGKHYPIWVAPLNTVVILAVFMYLSYMEIRAVNKKQ